MARARRRLGLALGSGGARGWCHIGVLRALVETGVAVDVVAGSSMGAVVGAAFAAGKLDALEAFARGLTRRKFAAMADLRLSGGGLLEGHGIEEVFEDIGVTGDIADLPMPFVAVATDLRTGSEIWLRDGPLSAAVHASAAIPGLISPRVDGDRLLLDGGLTNPVPVSAARALGAETVIAVNPNARPHGGIWDPPDRQEGFWSAVARVPFPLPPVFRKDNDAEAADPVPGYIDVVSASIDVMTEQIRRARLADDPPDLLINPDLTEMSVLDFHAAAAAIGIGRDETLCHRNALRGLAARD